jgi:hypothetical protein
MINLAEGAVYNTLGLFLSKLRKIPENVMKGFPFLSHRKIAALN